MDNQKPNPAATLPWYDDRVETVRKEYTAPVAEPAEEPTQYTPKQIYDYLDRKIWKQDEAKKAASVIMYNCLRGIRSTSIFCGPSGCGKTQIWRALQQLYPNRIEITDISKISQDSWRGSLKWVDLLRSPIFRSGWKSICVLDESDKMFSQKFTSGGNNASFDVQGEGLTLLEGTRVDVKDGSVTYTVDTSKISFVLLGAFSNKAHDIAEKSTGTRIGFGAASEPVQPYARPLNEQDLIDFGVMPEFLGRLQRIVNLQLMTEDDYFRMTDSSLGFLLHIAEQYKASIHLTPAKRRELAASAFQTGLGVRGMENQLHQLIATAIFDDCNRHSFTF